MRPWEESKWARTAGPAVCALALIALILGLAALGHGPDAPDRAGLIGIMSATAELLQGGVYAILYLLAALGLGRLPAWLLARASSSRIAVQLALGIALTLWLSHLLGVLGLLSGNHLTPRIVAWGVVALGLLSLADQMVRGDLAPERWPVFPLWLALGCPALAVMLVAAASPPGWLWESEFGGYDTMSYHLQLAKEWATPTPDGVGSLRGVDHNIYSHLPSYVEAAYLHLAQMIVPFGGAPDERLGFVGRILGGEGTWVVGCQALHALLGVVMATLIGRLVWSALSLTPATSHRERRIASIVAGCAALSIPWVVVVGSMAYNELGAAALLAGALLAAIDTNLRPLSRGALVGLLCGAACGCKPTMLTLGAPVAGIALILFTARDKASGGGPRAVLTACATGAIAGLAMLAPWLVRNWLDTGNPVFPFAASLFGTGTWTAEQIERYHNAHIIKAGLGERLALLLSHDRGLLHPQWSIAPALALVGLTFAAAAKPTRLLAIALGLGTLISLAAWLFTTHLQSRFLIPLVVPGITAFGLGAWWLMHWAASRARSGTGGGGTAVQRAATGVAILAPLALAGTTATLFLRERDGAPNAFLNSGVSALTGTAILEIVAASSPGAAVPPATIQQVMEDAASPVILTNLGLTPGLLLPGGDAAARRPGRVYLLGDATPLYFLAATGGPSSGVTYHTTWDRSPLGHIMAAAPDNPAAWTQTLLHDGYEFILVNFNELDRLITRDKYYDPEVTQERLSQWLKTPINGAFAVQAWPKGTDGAFVWGTGQVLFRLTPEKPR